MRADLRPQRCKVFAEQAAHDRGQEDQVGENARRRRQAIGGERWQRSHLVGFGELAQELGDRLSPALARHPLDGARQIGEPARLGDRHPHQTEHVGTDGPLENRLRQRLQTLLGG